MIENLTQTLTERKSAAYATEHGTRTHARLAAVRINDDECHGAQDLIAQIRAIPELPPFFGPNSRPEVPIAGTLYGRFVSRRIDRLYIDHDTKTIKILDFKTDIDRTSRREHYEKQLNEYKQLIIKVYPKYQVSCFILWLHDWTLDKIA